ncbi:MAG: flagellar hook protein, partial [Clostridia bacterium]|nr:flagellar hook protein [Clostridia bacterium]
MASVSGLSSSSSIYGNRNILSGLASGLDTETMIENSVAGLKARITGLQQDRTKLEWEQEAYRSIIAKMANFSDKYTSYTSSTNLMSSSFFNGSVKVESLGEFADLVSATGKGTSDVAILGVKQLASGATYKVNGIGNLKSDAVRPTITGDALNLDEKINISNMVGSITLTEGKNKSYAVNLSFDEEDEIYTAQDLVDKLNEKLKETKVTLGNGDTVTADTRYEVTLDGDQLKIRGKVNSANVTISGNMASDGGLKVEDKEDTDSTAVIDLSGAKISEETTGLKLLGKEMSFTVDGITKSFKLGDIKFEEDATPEQKAEKIRSTLEDKLDELFGDSKVDVTLENGALSFAVDRGSTLKIDNAKGLGLSTGSETSYANLSSTLKDVVTLTDDMLAKDEFGNVKKDKDGKELYELEINGKVVGEFNKDTALETVVNAINSNAEANVNLRFSQLTNEFSFTSEEQGASSRIEIQGGLAGALFGDTVDGEGNSINANY